MQQILQTPTPAGMDFFHQNQLQHFEDKLALIMEVAFQEDKNLILDKKLQQDEGLEHLNHERVHFYFSEKVATIFFFFFL